MDLILIIGFYIFIKLLITMSDLNAWQYNRRYNHVYNKES